MPKMLMTKTKCSFCRLKKRCKKIVIKAKAHHAGNNKNPHKIDQLFGDNFISQSRIF